MTAPKIHDIIMPALKLEEKDMQTQPWIVSWAVTPLEEVLYMVAHSQSHSPAPMTEKQPPAAAAK